MEEEVMEEVEEMEVVVGEMVEVVVSTSRTEETAAGCTQPCSMQRSISCHLLLPSRPRYA
jgi:hypothetical protein